jgi:hypothetical protein
MFEKQGKFYADWRDREGTRKRKAFNSSRAALRFEQEQKELAHPKQSAKGKPSPIPFSRKRPDGTNRQSAPQSKSSSQRVVKPCPINSQPRSSKRLTIR